MRHVLRVLACQQKTRIIDRLRWTLFCSGVFRHELVNSGATAVSTDNTIEEFAGCVSSLANVAAIPVKGSHLVLLEFGSHL